MIEEQVISAFMSDVRDDIKAMRVDIDSMNRLLIELGKLEVEHRATRESLGRAFQAVDKMQDRHELLDKRVQEIEKALPGLKETRVWIIGAVVGCVALVLIALSTLVIRPTQYIATPAVQGK